MPNFSALQSKGIKGANVEGQATAPLLGDYDTNVNATYIPNAELGNVFDLTLTNSIVMAAPINAKANQPILFRIRQDASGTRLITWNAIYKFSTSKPVPTLSLAPNAWDDIAFVYNEPNNVWECVGYTLGFS